MFNFFFVCLLIFIFLSKNWFVGGGGGGGGIDLYPCIILMRLALRGNFSSTWAIIMQSFAVVSSVVGFSKDVPLIIWEVLYKEFQNNFLTFEPKKKFMSVKKFEFLVLYNFYSKNFSLSGVISRVHVKKSWNLELSRTFISYKSSCAEISWITKISNSWKKIQFSWEPPSRFQKSWIQLLHTSLEHFTEWFKESLVVVFEKNTVIIFETPSNQNEDFFPEKLKRCSKSSKQISNWGY